MPNGWLNVTHYKQELPYSCLAACVRMVLGYHGRDLAEDAVRQLLGTQPAGTRAGNVSALASLGFDVHIGPSSFGQLQAMLAARIPPIVFSRPAR
jgi:ABC-type bacteriocin/lantibiotic exporter with double-glycine peptidase domain